MGDLTRHGRPERRRVGHLSSTSTCTVPVDCDCRGGWAGGRDRWRLVPIVGWIRSYQRRWLRGDLIAGFAVAALIVPKNLGYAGIAGIPLQNGLYAAAAGAILYPIFGTSRQISTGPSSGLAAVAASAVAVAGISGTDDVASFVALMTLASGALFLVLAVLKMGWIAQFLSRAVVTGFLFGAAIDVVIGELPKLTGTEVSGSNSLRELGSWFRTLGDAELATMVVGGAALAVVFGLRIIAPYPGRTGPGRRRSGGSRLFDLAARGVALVGEVPRGLPTLEIPDTQVLGDHTGTVAIAAVALVLIGFSQTAGDSRTFAARHRYRIDINQESVAQGMANVGAGLVQGMPVSTSLSASSLNDHTGARTGLASITSGVIVLLTLLFLAPLFSDLPKPVLAALIIEAVVMGMMDVPEMRRLVRVQPFDFWIAIAAIAGTLLFGVLAGVMVGIGLSLVWLISVATRPAMPLWGGIRPRSSSASWMRTLATSNSRAWSCSAWTAVCSSPPPTPSRTASARSRCRRPTSAGSCSTAWPSTTSTPRGRPRCATSSSSPSKPASRCAWPA